MENLYVIKIGGNIVDNPMLLSTCLQAFTQIKGQAILVHGGGKLATSLAVSLGVEQTMVEGRRITDGETLKIVTMVYAGYINKNIIAQLQAMHVNAIGLSGVDGNLIKAHKRANANIDYGFVGDIDQVNQVFIQQQKECVEGAHRSGTDAFKCHNLVTATDKKKMIPQIQLLSSDSGLYPNVLGNFFILFSVQSDDYQFNSFMKNGFASIRSVLIGNHDMDSSKLSYVVDALYENESGRKVNLDGLPYKMFQKLSVVFSITLPDYRYISDSTRELDPTKLFGVLSYYGSISRYTTTSCRSGHDIKDLPTYDSEGGNKTRKRTLRGRTLRGRTLRGRTLRGRKTRSRYIQ
jgi:hypothetical protein